MKQEAQPKSNNQHWEHTQLAKTWDLQESEIIINSCNSEVHANTSTNGSNE